jgi:cobalt-zinc-cadmium efflux system outer membrane protein
LLVLAVGCHAPRVDVTAALEAHVAEVAPARAAPDLLPCAAPGPALDLPDPLGLPDLWALALADNPALRTASADLEAARGRQIQAGRCPNPRLIYEQDTIGSSQAPAGNFKVELSQEIVTAGKNGLDRQIATRDVGLAGLGLVARKLEVLSRVRRAWYDYVSRVAAEQAGEEVVATLEEGLRGTRKLVEVKLRPQTDLLRIEALLEEARISLGRERAARESAWAQLAAEVGVPGLPPRRVAPPGEPPDWPADLVRARVLQTNTALKEGALAVERARLASKRAAAEAVPNVTVGGGYTVSEVEHAAGALVSLEAPLPLWDRKEGHVHEAQAKWVRARAALRETENRLTGETAAALAAYRAAREQVERLQRNVLPRLQTSLDLLRKGYQAGARQISFTDVLQAEQALATARLTLAEARRSLWLAVADLQSLMQLDLDEEPGPPRATLGPPRD